MRQPRFNYVQLKKLERLKTRYFKFKIMADMLVTSKYLILIHNSVVLLSTEIS